MDIIITKGNKRNTLTCKRQDGSVTAVRLGPNVPNHDFAHFIIEKKFNLQKGFFGTIKAGKTIDELSNPVAIQEMSPETWLSEILARNLQSLRSGAVEIKQFEEIIQWESEKINGIQVPEMTIQDISELKQDFDDLCKKWDSLRENENITLFFE